MLQVWTWKLCHKSPALRWWVRSPNTRGEKLRSWRKLKTLQSNDLPLVMFLVKFLVFIRSCSFQMIFRLTQCLSTLARGSPAMRGGSSSLVLQLNTRPPVFCRFVLEQNFSTSPILNQFKFGKQSPLPRWDIAMFTRLSHQIFPEGEHGPRRPERGTWRLCCTSYLQPSLRPGPAMLQSPSTGSSVRPPTTGAPSARATTPRRWRPWRSRRRDFWQSSSTPTPQLKWGELEKLFYKYFTIKL